MEARTLDDWKKIPGFFKPWRGSRTDELIAFSFVAAVIDASAVEMVFLSALESSGHFKV